MERGNRRFLCIAREGACARRSVVTQHQTPNTSFLIIISERGFDVVPKQTLLPWTTHPSNLDLLTVPLEVMEAHLMCLIPWWEQQHALFRGFFHGLLLKKSCLRLHISPSCSYEPTGQWLQVEWRLSFYWLLYTAPSLRAGELRSPGRASDLCILAVETPWKQSWVSASTPDPLLFLFCRFPVSLVPYITVMLLRNKDDPI